MDLDPPTPENVPPAESDKDRVIPDSEEDENDELAREGEGSTVHIVRRDVSTNTRDNPTVI